MKLRTITLAVMASAVATLVHAQTGTIGMVDIGTPSVSPGPSIDGGTSYTIGLLASFSSTTGVFNGLPTQVYGPVTFQPGVSTSFSFSSAAFGTFQSTNIIITISGSDTMAFHILGDYTGGTWDPSIVSIPASFDLTFTQNPPGVGGISDSGVFSIPPTTVVPEPSSMALLGIGASVLGFQLRRRRA